MITLRYGDQSNAVRTAQDLLNRRSPPSPHLNLDGKFGPKTLSAVKTFQKNNWLVVDGIVGPCTLAALNGTESYVISHAVRLIAQPTPVTCWAASTAMLLNWPISRILAWNATFSTSNGLPNDSELRDAQTMERYARHNNIKLIYGQSWMASGFAGLLRSYGPLMLNILWNPKGYTTPDPNNPGKYLGSSGHMIIASGIRGDNTSEGSTLRIYDPWPPNRGNISSFSYQQWMQNHPTGTYQILHR